MLYTETETETADTGTDSPGSVFRTSRLAELGGSWQESKILEANFLFPRFQEEAKTNYLMTTAYPKKYRCLNTNFRRLFLVQSFARRLFVRILSWVLTSSHAHNL